MGANQTKSNSHNHKEFASKKLVHLNSATGSCGVSVASGSVHSDVDMMWQANQCMAHLEISSPGDNNTLPTATDTLTSQHEGELVVALYDFQATLESQVSLRRGDQLHLLSYNDTGEWAEVDSLESGNRNRRRGWVPSSYLAPISGTMSSTATGGRHQQFSHQQQLAQPTEAASEPWYHGDVSRQDAENRLYSGISGSFLVRESESQPGQLSITVRHDERVYHYRISRDPGGLYYVTESHKFPTVRQLVEHHSVSGDGLICPLFYPAPKRNRNGNSGFAVNQSGMVMQSIDTNNLIFGDSWEIDRSEIIMRHKLGGGQYGDVYEALWKRCNSVVAVKTIKEDVNLKVNDFLEEAAIMKTLRHENLVALLGVCTREPPLYLVTEFMPQGNLLHYLHSHPRTELPPSLLLRMVMQIASGCAYLEKNNFIHRDLAARNCLVGVNQTVKVGDFGLARYMEQGLSTYTAGMGGKLPIKWTAPEGLAYNRFSTRSDVWSLGVVLWEVATYGQTPYPGIELQDVYHLLEKNYRMPRPRGCPLRLYAIMMRCWSWEAADRPTMISISAELKDMALNSNVDEEVARELERCQGHSCSNDKKRSRSTDPVVLSTPMNCRGMILHEAEESQTDSESETDTGSESEDEAEGDEEEDEEDCYAEEEGDFFPEASPAMSLPGEGPAAVGFQRRGLPPLQQHQQHPTSQSQHSRPTRRPGLAASSQGNGVMSTNAAGNATVSATSRSLSVPDTVNETQDKDGRETPDESGVGDSIVSNESRTWEMQGGGSLASPSGPGGGAFHHQHQSSNHRQSRSVCAAHRSRGFKPATSMSNNHPANSMTSSQAPIATAPLPRRLMISTPPTSSSIASASLSPCSLPPPPFSPTQATSSTTMDTDHGRQNNMAHIPRVSRPQPPAFASSPGSPLPRNSNGFFGSSNLPRKGPELDEVGYYRVPPFGQMPTPVSSSSNCMGTPTPNQRPINAFHNERLVDDPPSPTYLPPVPTSGPLSYSWMSPHAPLHPAPTTATSADDMKQPALLHFQYQLQQQAVGGGGTNVTSSGATPTTCTSSSSKQPTGVLDKASLNQFTTLAASDRIGRYLDSLDQHATPKAQTRERHQRSPQTALPSAHFFPNEPHQSQHKDEKHQRPPDDEDMESNTEEVTRVLDDTLSISSHSPSLPLENELAPGYYDCWQNSQLASHDNPESIVDSVNDLILQSEFLCATYPKLSTDLDNLAGQLEACRSRANVHNPQLSNACSLLGRHVTELRAFASSTAAAATTGSDGSCEGQQQQAVDINRCLARVQSVLMQLKTAVRQEHSTAISAHDLDRHPL